MLCEYINICIGIMASIYIQILMVPNHISAPIRIINCDFFSESESDINQCHIYGRNVGLSVLRLGFLGIL